MWSHGLNESCGFVRPKTNVEKRVGWLSCDDDVDRWYWSVYRMTKKFNAFIFSKKIKSLKSLMTEMDEAHRSLIGPLVVNYMYKDKNCINIQTLWEKTKKIAWIVLIGLSKNLILYNNYIERKNKNCMYTN